MTDRGILIAVEGIDGTGKSSVCEALAAWLREHGHEVVATAEPSCGPAGTEIRRRAREGDRLGPIEEMDLFREDRAEHADRVVRPALARGAHVVQDRSYVSSVAYQGARAGLSPERVLEANIGAAPEPDLVLLLRADPAVALARVDARGAGKDGFEEQGYLEQVAAVFDRLVRLGVRRVQPIDASRPLEQVIGRARAAAAAAIVEARDRDALRRMLGGVVKRGEFTLSSGRKSDFYIDGRLVTLTGTGARLSGRLVAAAARRHGATVVGGPALAACPIITAAGIAAADDDPPLGVFYVRKEAKKHGARNRLEGPPIGAEDRVLIVDDTATSGGSLLWAIEAVREETEASVIGAVGLVDRREGAREALEAAGVPFEAIFTRDEL